MEPAAPLMRSGPRDGQFTQRIAAVNEQPGARRGRHGDAPQHPQPGLGMPPVEGHELKDRRPLVWISG